MRQRWVAVVGLALLVGLVAATVMAAAAGARRNASALDRFRDVARARDVQVQVDDEDLRAPIFERLAQLPLVVDHGELALFPVLPTTEGLPELDVDLALLLSPDGGFGDRIDRGVLLRGRRADPHAVDEVVLNELVATASGLGPGDHLQVTAFTPEELLSVYSGGAFLGFSGPTLDLEVVGVVRQVDELQGDAVQAGYAVYGTSALLEAHGDEMGGLRGMWGARLDGRPGDVDELRRVVREVAGSSGEVFVDDLRTSEIADARDAISVSTSALIAFAVVAALAGAVVVGGALTRHVAASSVAASALRALGVPARTRAMAVVAPLTVSALGGAALGVVGASLASPLTPIGLARRAEPTPGLAFDPWLLPAALVIALAVLVWATRSAARVERLPIAATPDSRSLAASGIAGLELSPRVAIGVRAALDRRSQPRGIPVRTALGVAALGVAGIVASMTVVASFDALVNTPARYGWGWTTEPDAVEGIDQAIVSLRDEEAVDAVGLAHSALVSLDGLEVQGVAVEPIRGQLTGVISRGRPPDGPHEVALGARTAAALGVGLGDAIEAETAEEQLVSLTVVGTAVFRPVDNPSPGVGALLTPDGLAAVKRSEGFESVLLDYPRDGDVGAVEEQLAERHHLEFSYYSRPRVPGPVANLHAANDVVSTLGGFFAVLGLAGIVHALSMSVRRRRRDLMVLRALGLSRRSLRSIVRWQALAIMGVGLLVGTPVGIAAGRWVWRVMIGDLGVIDDPVTPWAMLAVTVLAAMITAIVVAWWPGRRTGRVSSTAVLRAT